MEQTAMTPAELLEVMRRRRLSLIIPAALVFLLGVGVALFWPPVYKSTATILIEEQEVPTDFVMTTVTSFAEQRIQQINQRIMSFSRLLEVIQQYGLYPELKESRTTEEIVEKMREDTALQPVRAEVIDRRTGRPTAATIAFTLSYQGRNPQKVQQVANVLVSLFLGENLKERVKQVEETSEFLESELVKLREELAVQESRLAAYKEQHINELPELLNANSQIFNNIERNIDALAQQLRSMKEREGYYQAQLSGLKPRAEKEEELTTRKRLEELKPFLLSSISGNPIWSLVGPLGLIGVLLLVFVLAGVTPAELSRIPFDTQEAETELAGGLLVEYSGRNLALFYLSSAVKTLVMGAIIVALFLPWNLSSYVAMPDTLAALADLAFFLAKVVLVMTIVVTLVRVGMARLRINQVVTVYWIYLSAIGLAGILLLMADAALSTAPGWI